LVAPPCDSGASTKARRTVAPNNAEIEAAGIGAGGSGLPEWWGGGQNAAKFSQASFELRKQLIFKVLAPYAKVDSCAVLSKPVVDNTAKR
jgi:hypothetical protein